jgi:hypothetical protein
LVGLLVEVKGFDGALGVAETVVGEIKAAEFDEMELLGIHLVELLEALQDLGSLLVE